jgi:hypothetical protein
MQSGTIASIRLRLQSRYGDFLGSREQQRLNPAKVPEKLWLWIPYAELWGIDDDYDRETLVKNAPQCAREDLIAIAAEIDDELNEWLAGDEAATDPPSQEYCAFTTLRLAADYALTRASKGA